MVWDHVYVGSNPTSQTMKLSYRMALKKAKKRYREKYKERPPYFFETLIFLNLISWISRKSFTKKNSYAKIEYVSDDYITITEENDSYKIKTTYYYNGRPWLRKFDKIRTDIIAKDDQSAISLKDFIKKQKEK